MEAMAFFQLSAGKWRSQRTTHHLPFRMSEAGESNIEVAVLAADDPKVLEVCEMHQIPGDRAAGGASVTWKGTQDWDKDNDEDHQGATVLVLVPDADNPSQGMLLREQGYAEKAPVAGRYEIEDEVMVLITEYETMSSIERLWFPEPDVRMRASTVKRFGGFSTASFCTEVKAEVTEAPAALEPKSTYSALGW